MRLLLVYSWPGNVRELANVMEYAVAGSKIETILPEDLPEEIRHPSPPSRSVVARRHATVESEPHPNESRSPESEHLVATLEAHHWHRAAAAKALG